MRAAFCSSLRRSSARIESSVGAGAGGLASASALPPAATLSIRPAWAISVSADRLSASEICLSTRTEGWCRPRSIWLRYGFDRWVSSASWRRDRLAIRRWVRMNAPSASRWDSHGSVTATSWFSQTIVRGSAGIPVLPRRGFLVALLAGLGRGVLGRGQGLHHVLGELALAGQQLLGEVVRVGHDLLRLGQPVGERHVQGRQLGGDGLDGLDPGLDRLDDGLLALADGAQDLVLDFLRAGRHDVLSFSGFVIANYTKHWIGMSSAMLDIHSRAGRCGGESGAGVDGPEACAGRGFVASANHRETQLGPDRDMSVLGVRDTPP